MQQPSNTRRTIHALAQATAVLTLALAALSAGAQQHSEHQDKAHFSPGNLVISRSVYDNNPANVKVGTILPPNCASTQGGCAAATGAVADGTYPFVFNNDTYDSSFGITSRIFLDQLTPNGRVVDSLEVPNSLDRGIKSTSDQLVTSFSSKSEIALPSRPIVAPLPLWVTSRRSTPSTSQTPIPRSPSIRPIPSGRNSFAA